MRRLTIFIVVALLAGACSEDDAADPERFCEINSEIQQLPEFFGAPPDAARETVEQARSLLDEAVKVVPDEIGSSVEIASDNFIQILDLFEEADFDEEQMDQAELDALFEEEGAASAASDALDAWVDANCST